MAKKHSGGVNKSQLIRDYHKAHPKQKPKQIAEELGKQKIKVSAQFVSTVLSTSKKKSIGKPGRPKGSVSVRRGRPPGRPLESPRSSTQEVSIASLLKVKQIVTEMGGIDDVRRALTTLEQIMK